MLSFEEFRAVNKRENARSTSAPPSQTKPAVVRKSMVDESDEVTTSEKITDERPQSRFGNLISNMGEFLEMHQMQAFYVFLVLIDMVCAIADLKLSCSPEFPYHDVIMGVITSLSTFSTMFFIAELV